jgi:DNA modification methylase
MNESKRPFRNRLNDLDPKTWLKFQKSWFTHNPPPRQKNVLRHPAKFPESLAQEFIEFFTKENQYVLDPMLGTGSTLVAALRSRRNGIGIELNPGYANIARQVIGEEKKALEGNTKTFRADVINASATCFPSLVKEHDLPLFDYVLTSPPYWDMLRVRGAETQKKRRQSSELDVFYSDDPEDLGNISDYDEFLMRLVSIYANLKPYIKKDAYLTIIVKNVKKGGRIYPLAWDLALRLRETYTLKDEKIWCQDDIRLAPYGLGSAWVSNTFHHYCLQFRNSDR